MRSSRKRFEPAERFAAAPDVCKIDRPPMPSAIHQTVLVVLLAFAVVEPAFSARVRVPDEVQALTADLLALSPQVRSDEASRFARVACRSSQELAREYRLVRSPHFHNFLVNAGLRDRGLCHEWARDLGARLSALRSPSLGLRWGIARAGTLREHNCVVVTAKDQPFSRGLILDGWRHSGRLYWTRVAADRYPWKEDTRESFRRPVSARGYP